MSVQSRRKIKIKRVCASAYLYNIICKMYSARLLMASYLWHSTKESFAKPENYL